MKISPSVYQKLLSKDRLDSYKDISQHHKNLQLIGEIAPQILLIEICLRNTIDSILSQDNTNWLLESNEEFIKQAIQKEQERCNYTLTHNQLVSKMTLGFWTKILKSSSYKDKLVNIVPGQHFNLKDYYINNTNKIGKHKIKPFTKLRIVFELLRILRNRAFHAENLYKLDKDTFAPSLYAVFGKSSFRLETSKLEKFLNDILDSFNASLKQDLKGGDSL